ncbi:hypothetical protein PanWU01x14_030780, partial [Parasponia andersonii]
MEIVQIEMQEMDSGKQKAKKSTLYPTTGKSAVRNIWCSTEKRLMMYSRQNGICMNSPMSTLLKGDNVT